MTDDEKELLENYRVLSQENKAHLSSLAHATRTAQETTKKFLKQPKTSLRHRGKT